MLNQKIVVCDIDGVLNYYPNTILKFIKDCDYGDFDTLHQAKESLSYADYNKLKDNYRKSEYKHSALVKENAKELLEYFRKNNYFIILLTARKCTEDMVVNTINWLKRNNLIYDYVYFSAKKDVQLYEKFKSVEVIIDDSISNLEKIYNANSQARYYLINNKDNSFYDTDKYITRVDDLDEIIQMEERNV